VSPRKDVSVVAFVSVHSERDTPEQMKLYLSSSIRISAASRAAKRGSQQIASAFGVYYKRVVLEATTPKPIQQSSQIVGRGSFSP
jgi:cytochrome oxidase Cu insertion factor (SCO1/SenC/PrrC family)